MWNMRFAVSDAQLLTRSDDNPASWRVNNAAAQTPGEVVVSMREVVSSPGDAGNNGLVCCLYCMVSRVSILAYS